jgi:hypothetical protein
MGMVAERRIRKSDPVFVAGMTRPLAILGSIESAAQEEIAVITAARQVMDISQLDTSVGARGGATSIR